ncbi:MAG: hypothetical protein FD120_1457 [Gammaproteobacteria bacterium]|nr:MAG: hypothetical protein FD120_1457 [Gammaproteobacteria bacterium]
MLPVQVLLLEKIPWLWKARRREFSFFLRRDRCGECNDIEMATGKEKIVNLKLKDTHHQDFL